MKVAIRREVSTYMEGGKRRWGYRVSVRRLTPNGPKGCIYSEAFPKGQSKSWANRVAKKLDLAWVSPYMAGCISKVKCSPIRVLSLRRKIRKEAEAL